MRLNTLALVAAGLTAALCGCSKKERIEEYVYPPVTNACKVIARIENPTGAADRVFVKELAVKNMTSEQFFDELIAMPGEDVHLWMPGHDRWLLIGHATTNKVSLAEIMETFATDDAAESPTEYFSAYVGTRDEVLPAFRSKLEGTVLPEWYVSKALPSFEWIDLAGVDGDIAKAFAVAIRDQQAIRRQVIEGDIIALTAKDKKGEEAAIAKWHLAALRNPNDLFLRERLNRLERNARGFLEVGKVLQAMKCFETMLCIHTTAANVHNFGMCLKKIGKLDLAEKVLKRAKELEK